MAVVAPVVVVLLAGLEAAAQAAELDMEIQFKAQQAQKTQAAAQAGLHTLGQEV